MSQAMNDMSEVQKRQPQPVSPREILFRYIHFLPLVIASVIIFVVMTYVRLRYEPNIYSVTATLMVKDPNTRTPTGESDLEELLFMGSNKNIEDEIQVVQTRRIGQRVVRALGLELQFYNEGKIRTSMINPPEAPVRLSILSLKDSTKPFKMMVRLLDEQKFTVGEDSKPIAFGQSFDLPEGSFMLFRKSIALANFNTSDFIITYASPEQRAGELLKGLVAVPSGTSNNIMRLTFETENPRLGLDVLNQWMLEYQKLGLEENKQSAENTLSFINIQLSEVNDELAKVEDNLQRSREKNMVINVEAQSQKVFDAINDLDKEIVQQSVQLELVDNLIKYITDESQPYRQVGSLLGLQEPSLAAQINEFNRLQVERETMLKTTTRANPMIQNMETTISRLRQDIKQNLNNIRQGLRLTVGNLTARNQLVGKEISRLPAKEKEMLDIARRQKILEQVYSFLMEKKVETSISSASTLSNVKVLESAQASNIPVRPNKKASYITAFLLGFGIPVFIIFLLEYLNDKVKGRQDVMRNTSAPIIGELGHSQDEGTLVVSPTSRKFIAEQFRIIRTNLKYFLTNPEKAVILVTSSTSGEGKSFISTNMGAVLALSGKRTVILEFDIRKPRILSGLGLHKREGITNHVIGRVEYEELPIPVPGIENLFVIACGPIPPNPSELLLDPRLDAFIQRVREDYDVVIMDTAPVGLVGDAVVLGKHADASLYVVRHNYTFKKQLQLLDDIYTNRRLPRMSLVLNDIQAKTGGYGGYYGYGGYGYGAYGSSYGANYFEADKRKRQRGRKFIQSILNWFGIRN
jgi:tyrosine-protein kinase Etk/Wzc